MDHFWNIQLPIGRASRKWSLFGTQFVFKIDRLLPSVLTKKLYIMQLMQAIDVIHLHKHIEKKQDKHNKNKVKKKLQRIQKNLYKRMFYIFLFCILRRSYWHELMTEFKWLNALVVNDQRTKYLLIILFSKCNFIYMMVGW